MSPGSWLKTLLTLLSWAILPSLSPAADQELSHRDYPGLSLGGGVAFGSALASSGDWLAVGAPAETFGFAVTYAQERVVLWKREAGQWNVRQLLPSADAPYGTARHYGHAVAMDGSRLLVSTLQNDVVFAYRLEGDAWVPDGELKPQGASSSAVGFGAAIALQGDVAVIGSPDGTVGQQTKAGWVDVFQRQASGWVHQARVADAAPRSSAGLGRSLALHGNFIFTGIYNHELPSMEYAGKVVVFQKTGNTWAWSRDLVSPMPAARASFGGTIKVADGRLFVSSSYVYPSTSGKIFEFSIQGGLGLVSQTAANGLYAASADLLVTLAPSIPSTIREVHLLRRQPDQSWSIERRISHESLFRLQSALVKDGDVLIGSNADLTPGSHGSQGTPPGIVNRLRKQPDGSWTHDEPLTLISSLLLSGSAFGRRIAVSDTWLVVGAPIGYNTSANGGLVFIYRKGAGGQWVFHSLLPQPVSADMHPGFIGARVALSGDLMAVGTSDDDTYWPVSSVFMFRYDVPSDTWKQEAAISPLPGRSGEKGLDLALEGDLLAIRHSPFVALYRHSAAGWEVEAVINRYSNASALHEGRLVIANSYNKDAFVYEKKATDWVETAKLVPAKPSGFDEFGRFVSISGTRIMIGCGPKNPSLAVPFDLVNNAWQRGTPLVKPPSWAKDDTPWNADMACSLSGSVAIFKRDNQTALYVQNQSGWVEARSALPVRNRVDSIILQGGHVLTGSGVDHVWTQDLVKAPGSQVVSEYPQITTTNGITTFDAGKYAVGTEDAQFAILSAFPHGIAPVRVSVSLSGDTSEFTLSQTQFDVAINDDIRTLVRFKPLTAGSREVRVTFTPDMPGAQPTTYAFRCQVVSDKIPLQFTQQPLSGFLPPAGELTALECQLTGTRPWTLRWFKNGKALQTTNSLRLPLAAKAIGRYQVEVTNAAGTLRSREVLVGEAESLTESTIILRGRSASLRIRAAGPGVSIQWGAYQESTGDWIPLTDTHGISGSRTPTLTVQNARQSTFYSAHLTLPAAGEPGIGEVHAHLQVTDPPKISLKSRGNGHWQWVDAEHFLRGEYTEAGVFIEAEDSYLPDPVVRISGAPPGMTVTPSGGLSGRPTTTGIYPITISIRSGTIFSSAVVKVAVTEPELPLPGIFWGWLDSREDSTQKYAVVADLQPNGAISAVIHMGEKRYPLAGVLRSQNGYQSSRVLIPYQIDGQDQIVWLDMKYVAGNLLLNALTPGSYDSSAVEIAELRLIKPHTLSLAPAGLGRHNVGLLSQQQEESGGPLGHGFGSLTVAHNHRVNYVFQMPDGTSLTGASWMSDPLREDGVNSLLYLYETDKNSRTQLHGMARLTSDVNAEEPPLLDNLTWRKMPGRGRILASGFEPVEMTFVTSRPWASTSRLMKPGADNSLTFSAPGLALNSMTFQVSALGQARFVPGQTNAVQTRLDLYAPTGFFTGQLTLRDASPLNPQRMLTRQIPFAGMLLPEHGMGVGSFLIPALPDAAATPPTTLQTSPLSSGAVKIEVMENN